MLAVRGKNAIALYKKTQLLLRTTYMEHTAVTKFRFSLYPSWLLRNRYTALLHCFVVDSTVNRRQTLGGSEGDNKYAEDSRSDEVLK